MCGETDNIRDARHQDSGVEAALLLTALRLGTGDSLEFLKALKYESVLALLILVYSANSRKPSSPSALSVQARRVT